MARQPSLFDDLPPAGRQGRTLPAIEAWLKESSPRHKKTGEAPWLEGYLYLRSKGARYRDAMLAVWLSLSKDDRGEIDTREKFAQLMGISRATTYDWETKRPQIRQWAEFLQVVRMRGARLAEVDEATYNAAVGKKSSAADRKLYYQRAGVWEERVGVRPVGEEAGPNEYVNVTDAEREAIRQALIGEAEGGGEAG